MYGSIVARQCGRRFAKEIAGKDQEATVTWDASTDTTWAEPDATSWDAPYASNDVVQFQDTGAGTVTISGPVHPAAIDVNSSVAYTFSGDGIDGTGTLSKAGTADLTLSG